MNRLSEYRIMWIMTFFDLPTETKVDRKRYMKFRKHLLEDGFQMFQFSVYWRHCASRENAEVHIQRVKDNLPPCGSVAVIRVTDKQFGAMEIFRNSGVQALPKESEQLRMFFDDEPQLSESQNIKQISPPKPTTKSISPPAKSIPPSAKKKKPESIWFEMF
ncbi:hypothetical protein AGMMS49938_18400 [Fibrobacterales bacterium]|nr:hypothetical protein AGMMS49938_18400 [Fibrobacterales bacterium]